MNPKNRENLGGGKATGFRGMLQGLLRPKKRDPFATIIFNGKELDTTDALPSQNKPEGEIKIPEGDLNLRIPENPADGPEVNIERLPAEKPQRRRSDGNNFDKKIAATDISWLERLLREGFRKMFTRLIGKPEAETRQPKTFTYNEAPTIKENGCRTASVKAGDIIYATNGYVAAIKYESTHKILNPGETAKAREDARVAFIPEGVGFLFKRGEKTLAVWNHGGVGEETHYEPQTSE